MRGITWKRIMDVFIRQLLKSTYCIIIIIIIIIIRFSLMCRYRDNIHNSGLPSRQLACCTHGRSHTRSLGVSIMRVDSWELPLSVIPLCQLLPSHLGPPRPMLSINLYIKDCLDCTVGAFHVSIPAEPSLFQYEVQVFNAEPCKLLLEIPVILRVPVGDLLSFIKCTTSGNS